MLPTSIYLLVHHLRTRMAVQSGAVLRPEVNASDFGLYLHDAVVRRDFQ